MALPALRPHECRLNLQISNISKLRLGMSNLECSKKRTINLKTLIGLTALPLKFWRSG